MSGATTISIDEERINEDKQWDGLKGYLTNTLMTGPAIIENYKHLWQIEKAFRISKTDLKVRPIFHHLRKRIEAHICIAFVAYTIYKELERLLEGGKTSISPKRAAELTHNMYELEYTLPNSREIKKRILRMCPEQQIVHDTVVKG